MCRFLAYKGERRLVLSTVLDHYENSMIQQSYRARETQTGLNADGFGLAWYVPELDPRPGLFRSTRPAWNDNNLRHLAPKLRSNCFLAHVRASTVGDVNSVNCHPFENCNRVFAHNGTIQGFQKIRRQVLSELDDDSYDQVKGTTDSEAFFALLCTKLKGDDRIEKIVEALDKTIEHILEIQQAVCPGEVTRLNTVLIDGKNLVVSRFDTKPNPEPLGLYYALPHVSEDGKQLDLSGTNPSNAVLFASEILDNDPVGWEEVPPNTIIYVDSKMNLSLKKIGQ